MVDSSISNGIILNDIILVSLEISISVPTPSHRQFIEKKNFDISE